MIVSTAANGFLTLIFNCLIFVKSNQFVHTNVIIFPTLVFVHVTTLPILPKSNVNLLISYSHFKYVPISK